MKRGLFAVACLGLGLAAAVACGSSDGDPDDASPDSGVGGGAEGGPRGIEPAGQTCSAPTQCYAGLADGGGDAGIVGTVTCLTKVTNGYCTHTCTTDTDCCAVPGECRTGVKEVCSPFTNQTDQYCFLSCEDGDITRAVAANVDAGVFDGGQPANADDYCRVFAGTSTTCRSTGGGSKNRKVCIPQE